MYFPTTGQVGIDVSNSGVVLLSQNGFTDWKFYLIDLSEDPPKPKTEVLILQNGNWPGNFFTKFHFSE